MGQPNDFSPAWKAVELNRAVQRRNDDGTLGGPMVVVPIQMQVASIGNKQGMRPDGHLEKQISGKEGGGGRIMPLAGKAEHDAGFQAERDLDLDLGMTFDQSGASAFMAPVVGPIRREAPGARLGRQSVADKAKDVPRPETDRTLFVGLRTA